MKILIAPDKFKGSLTATEVAEIIKESILNRYPEFIIETLPMADGGEGTLEVLSEVLELLEVKMFVKDPLFRTTTASYYKKDKVAYVEMATASGLQLIKANQRNPLYTTTYGTGQLIKHALKNGAEEVYLFVGGSATNDGGMGMLQTLGFQFLDKNGEDLFGIGENMIRVIKIISPENPLNFKLNVVCDVQNVFFGSDGAAHVYAAQKGANLAEIEELDAGLQNLANVFKRDLGKDISLVKGSGAAGGIAGGAVAALGAAILPGIETIMSIVGLKDKLKDVDLVITGEGKLDLQTLHGKLIAGIAAIAKQNNIKTIAFCGLNELNQSQIAQLNLSDAVALVQDGATVEEAISNAKALLKDRVKAYSF